jgi:hypothetical protein
MAQRSTAWNYPICTGRIAWPDQPDNTSQAGRIVVDCDHQMIVRPDAGFRLIAAA